MNERDRIKRNLLYNEKWVERDPSEQQRKYRRNARAYSKTFNGKSPEIILEGDEITWKRPSKHG